MTRSLGTASSIPRTHGTRPLEHRSGATDHTEAEGGEAAPNDWRADRAGRLIPLSERPERVPDESLASEERGRGWPPRSASACSVSAPNDWRYWFMRAHQAWAKRKAPWLLERDV